MEHASLLLELQAVLSPLNEKILQTEEVIIEIEFLLQCLFGMCCLLSGNSIEGNKIMIQWLNELKIGKDDV